MSLGGASGVVFSVPIVLEILLSTTMHSGGVTAFVRRVNNMLGWLDTAETHAQAHMRNATERVASSVGQTTFN